MPSSPPRPIERLLIANRGEIAIRIARAARESGIVPLGIYSDADERAAHVDAMDDALRIGPGPASESYLDIGRVVHAARELRADALHPGYGFLSERAAFARAVIEAGVVFVGPTPEAIAAMGDKSEAKRRAREAGVPVVPGYDGDDQTTARLRAEAETIGTPVLIKATAGGGGRGMRVVDDLATFEDALAAARREAQGAFGDDRVLLEKYLTRPRHIEFQILGDNDGTTLHFGERECSIQRRHQKLIEEAPSVALDGALRERMGAAAVRAAQAVGYTNAGTVEFLLDATGAFYFLEMNARLQVEHPVTESVYGIDLVRRQLAIAGGAALDLRQEQIVPGGWAIEARINAEDPQHDYLPATGTITRWNVPPAPDVRIDAGVRDGSAVSIYYDSLLAKVIASGPDRHAAIEALTRTLAATHIGGVATNVPLLLEIVRNPDFRRGDTATTFLGEHPALATPQRAAAGDGPLFVAAAAVLADPRSWRVAGVGIPLRLQGEGRDVAWTASRTAAAASRDGATQPGVLWRLDGEPAAVIAGEVVGERVAVRAGHERHAGRARVDAAGVEVTYARRDYRFTFAPPPKLGGGSAQATAGADAVVSPMPGKIIKVAVGPGDAVGARDLLVVLEAMKMEHRIEASRDGIVRAVNVEPGAVVRGGATLIELESPVDSKQKE
ncbi:MAG: ATP-grasp domain-containing protein [Candidatus Eremiobacteraeota bacterium]|nr:ATP-grasp domain-containing protein [Candidatus Eremiobacteraeota bacterium]MBC5803089.1 ATP-grasp domain-containing protein [Candidatus Eremiobacteraeota bacterium]MBC5823088.1 ATP-grasp domain-containing protein [Candidatus Eremiobacteraeota bacterium]